MIRFVREAKKGLFPRKEPLSPDEPLSEKQLVACPMFLATVSSDTLTKILEFLPERFRGQTYNRHGLSDSVATHCTHRNQAPLVPIGLDRARHH